MTIRPLPAHRRAFTLTELVLAILILVCAVIPIIDVFTGASRQARQTSDFGLAMAIEEKVAEELRLANWEDVHFGQEIEENAADLSQSAPVVDGRSPFFGAIEDSSAPFGRIRSGEDRAVTTGTGSLYTALRSFRVGATSASRNLPSTGQVLDVGVGVDWTDFRAQPASMTLGVVLARHGTPAVRPPAVTDRAQADLQIRRTFYPTFAERTLTQVVDSTGGQLATVRALGDAALIVLGLRTAEELFLRRLQATRELADRAPTPGAKAVARLDLARMDEAQASAYLHALVYLAGPVEDLALRFDPAHLGSSSPPPKVYRGSFRYLDSLRVAFGGHLTGARREYASVYNDLGGSALRPRVRTRLFMKVLALRKLEILTVGPEDPRSLKLMLADFMEYHEGRNPNFYQFAAYELERLTDLASVRRDYPAQLWLSAYRRFKDAVPRAMQRIAGD